MFIFSLCVLSSSVWWDYSDSEIDDKLSKAHLNPIFAIFYTDYCPKCIGFPEALMKHAESVKETQHVVFTKINCMNTSFCNNRGISGVPTFALIKSNDTRYWEFTAETGDPGWTNFLKYSAAMEPIMVESNKEISFLFQNIHRGYTGFHLVVDNSSLSVLDEYKAIAKKYIPFGCRFSYRIKEKATPSLKAYLSSSCMTKIKGKLSSFGWFIDTNKFSHLHFYIDSELPLLNKTIPTGFYFTPRFPSFSQRNALETVSESLCGRMLIGIKQTDDPAHFVMTNQESGCNLTWSGRLNEMLDKKLPAHIFSTQLCERYHDFKLDELRKSRTKQHLFRYSSLVFIAALFSMVRVIARTKIE